MRSPRMRLHTKLPRRWLAGACSRPWRCADSVLVRTSTREVIMTEAIDQHFSDRLHDLDWLDRPVSGLLDGARSDTDISDATYLSYFDAQLQSRHLDFASRWLQRQGQGFYTIGSAGHESNAAVAMALRPTDPALLHYRSGGFFAARAAQVDGTSPVSYTHLTLPT